MRGAVIGGGGTPPILDPLDGGPLCTLQAEAPPNAAGGGCRCCCCCGGCCCCCCGGGGCDGGGAPPGALPYPWYCWPGGAARSPGSEETGAYPPPYCGCCCGGGCCCCCCGGGGGGGGDGGETCTIIIAYCGGTELLIDQRGGTVERNKMWNVLFSIQAVHYCCTTVLFSSESECCNAILHSANTWNKPTG